jgi:hypothetical protein
MSNAPVGLTAIVLGAGLTAYLDEIEFNKWVSEAVIEYWKVLGYHVPELSNQQEHEQDEEMEQQTSSHGEFYSSIFVLLITGIWTFVLSVMVNAPAESSEKKEL